MNRRNGPPPFQLGNPSGDRPHRLRFPGGAASSSAATRSSIGKLAMYVSRSLSVQPSRPPSIVTTSISRPSGPIRRRLRQVGRPTNAVGHHPKRLLRNLAAALLQDAQPPLDIHPDFLRSIAMKGHLRQPCFEVSAARSSSATRASISSISMPRKAPCNTGRRRATACGMVSRRALRYASLNSGNSRSLLKKGTDYSVPKRKHLIRGAVFGVDRAVCPLFRQAPRD
jgi:hypothetical protein